MALYHENGLKSRLACLMRTLAGLLALLHTSLGVSEVNGQLTLSVLMSTDAEPYQQALLGFQSELASYAQQIDYRIYNARGAASTAADIAAESRADDESVMTLCIGTLACDAIQQLPATQTPVLVSMVADEASINDIHHGTGVYLNFLPATQLRQHAALFPELTRVGVLYSQSNSAADIDRAKLIARQSGLELIAIAIDSPRQFPTMLKSLLRQIDVLWALPDPDVLSPQTAREMMLASFRNRIPLIGSSASWTRSGALYSLDRNYVDVGAQVALMARQILNGTPVTAISPSEPRSISYTLNARTADHMRLHLDNAIKSQAQEIFQ